MRDLEQAKAEVFRRSKARIKKRKTIQRSIVACCVPLVLCMGAFSVTILPAMMPAKSAAPESAMMDNMNGMGMSTSADDMHFSVKEESKVDGSSEQTPSICFQGEEYAISNEDALTLVEMLSDLHYSPHRVCRCLPQYTFDFYGAEYGIHLQEGYARCQAGQASLTEDQLQQIRDIFIKYKLG